MKSAEREMGLLQDMVTAARKLKADNGLDDKMELAGVLYCRNGLQKHRIAGGGVARQSKAGSAHGRAARADRARFAPPPSSIFRCSFPKVDHEALRQRLTKENDKLQKLVVNIDRQLESEKFLNGAPPHVVESLRAKRAEYVAQIKKNRDMLDQL